jgi:hypothetical protein
LEVIPDRKANFVTKPPQEFGRRIGLFDGKTEMVES